MVNVKVIRVREWLCANFEDPEEVRIKAIEGARGMAIFFVFLVHLHEFLLPFTPPSQRIPQVTGFIYTVGNLAGDFFLVMTGFFIYRSLLSRPMPYFPFISRHLARIYPVFLCILTSYLLLSVLFPAYSKLPAHIGDAPLYVLENLALLPGLFPIRPIITVSWTLSFIVLFYLTMPLLMTFTGMRSWTDKKRFLFVALFLVSTSVMYVGTGLLPLRLNMLLVGVLLAEFVVYCRRHPLPTWFVAAMACAVPIGIAIRYLLVLARGVSVFEVCRSPDQTCITAACLFCFCYCLLAPEAPLAAFFTWSPLRWFGNISYSYYLSHSLAIKFLSIAATPFIAVAVRSEFGFWAIQPLLFALSLIPAIALFIFVEKRSRTKGEKPLKVSVARTLELNGLAGQQG